MEGRLILGSIPGIAMVEGIIVAGGVVSFGIGGTEGVLNYVDFITDKDEWMSLGIPTTLEYSLPIIYEEVIEPEIVAPVTNYLETKKRQATGFVNTLIEVGTRHIERGLPSIKYSI